jgi:hypothetical protein
VGIATAGVCLCFVALISNCGGDRSDSDNAPTAGGPGKLDETAAESHGSWADSSQKENVGAADTGDIQLESSNPSKREVDAFHPKPGADNSIQTFGHEVEGKQAAEVASAMRAFLRSVAAADYGKICGGLAHETVAQIEEFTPSKPERCSATLKTIMAPRRSVEAEVENAAHGVIYQVRTEDATAFVLFTPIGGNPSVFVMKRQNGEWKSTGIAPGRPINPAS